jgi:hypothetical protein
LVGILQTKITGNNGTKLIYSGREVKLIPSATASEFILEKFDAP